jgi:branched-chain amino acid transport system ATP-binding protein
MVKPETVKVETVKPETVKPERLEGEGAVLQALGLQKSFGALMATRDLSLRLHHGRIHALIGPNGAGKTTALAQLSGELRPDRGRVLVDGQDITGLDMARRAKLGIARSFQITAVLEGFTALENVALAVQARSSHHFRFWRDARRERALSEPARRLLERVGLGDKAETPAASLSHGQKRQLEVAMALATEPRVLLLDEPMAGMGPSETAAMTELIRAVKADHAVLLVEHDMAVVFALADEVSVLVYGSVIASGTPQEVRASPEARRAYLKG